MASEPLNEGLKVNEVFILPCLQEKRKIGESEQEPGLIDSDDNITKLALPSDTSLEFWGEHPTERRLSARAAAAVGRAGAAASWLASPVTDRIARGFRERTGASPGQVTRVWAGDYGSRLFNPYWFDASYVAASRTAAVMRDGQTPSLQDIFGDARKNFLVPLVPVDTRHPQKKCEKEPNGIEWATLLRFMATFCGAPAPVQPNSGDDTATAPRPKTLMLVSHHNRIKHSYFPMMKNKEGCNAYANCICFKVTIDHAGLPSVDIVFSGFKDKDSYKYCEQDDIEQISKAKLDAGISLLSDVEKEKLVGCSIYLIRHGNSLHNQPNGIKTIDSVLTNTGRAEAIHLAKLLHKKDDFKNELIIGASFLSRAQLTALEILNEMGKIGPGLADDLEILRRSAAKKLTEVNAVGPQDVESATPAADKFAGGKIRKKQRKTINKRKNNKKTNKRLNKRLNKTNKRLNKTQKRK